MTLATVVEGDIQCPHCKSFIVTPMGTNPYTGSFEKMIAHSFFASTCPICKKSFYLDAEQAKIHNHYHFPDDINYQ